MTASLESYTLMGSSTPRHRSAWLTKSLFLKTSIAVLIIFLIAALTPQETTRYARQQLSQQAGHLSHKISSASSSHEAGLTHARWDSIEDFSDAWADTEWGGPFDGDMLAQICERTTWRKGIVFQIDSVYGGIGNVRAKTLDFFFYALHYGGAIVLPKITKRNENELVDLGSGDRTGFHSFGNIFDQDWFFDKMEKHCPQMKIYNDTNDIADMNGVAEIFTPPEARFFGLENGNLAKGYAKLDNWIVNRPDFVNDANTNNLVTLHWTYWNYDLSVRRREASMLGNLFRISRPVRKLAGKVIYNLQANHSITSGVKVNPTHLLHRGLFFGAHLRTESDAVKEHWLEAWGGYESQSARIFSVAQSKGLSTIYLATGDENEEAKFKADAARQNMVAISKYDLLFGEDKAALEGFHWDLKGMVDYEIMARSDYFIGVSVSSFSWNVAVRRHQLILDDPRRKECGEEARTMTEGDSFEDGLSLVTVRKEGGGLGTLENWALRNMFP